MIIETINEHQIKLLLNFEDLYNNHISLHSFMCNSKDCKKFYLNVLNKTLKLSPDTYTIDIESFFISSTCSCILLITYNLRKPTLHTVKKNINYFSFRDFFWLKFKCFEDFCMFCNFLNIRYRFQSSLYLLNGAYFLKIVPHNIKDYFRILTISKDFACTTYGSKFSIDSNANTIIENSALETCKKYFI